MFVDIHSELDYLFAVNKNVLDLNYRVGVTSNIVSALTMNATSGDKVLNMSNFKRYLTSKSERVYLVYNNTDGSFEYFDKMKTDVFAKTLVVDGVAKTFYVINADIFDFNTALDLARYIKAVTQVTGLVVSTEYMKLITYQGINDIKNLFDNAIIILTMAVVDKYIKSLDHSRPMMITAFDKIGFSISPENMEVASSLLSSHTIEQLLDNSMLVTPLYDPPKPEPVVSKLVEYSNSEDDGK